MVLGDFLTPYFAALGNKEVKTSINRYSQEKKHWAFRKEAQYILASGGGEEGGQGGGVTP